MNPEAPIAIGAVGGSGTRVYARMLQELGWDLGDLLNGALDNLVFSALFKEPSLDSPLSRDDLERRGATFARFMSGERLRPRDRILLGRTALRHGDPAERPDRHLLLGAGRRTTDHWAWKEPNTQLFLEPLAASIPGLRYLHVLRHGLDLAFSANTAQLRNFGPRFGIEWPDDPDLVPVRQLDYWIASTRRVLAILHDRFPDRHLVSRFDALYDDPRAELTRILDFIEPPVAQGTANRDGLLDRLESLVALPETRGRYRHEDLRRFRADQLQAVEDLGFEIRTP